MPATRRALRTAAAVALGAAALGGCRGGSADATGPSGSSSPASSTTSGGSGGGASPTSAPGSGGTATSGGSPAPPVTTTGPAGRWRATGPARTAAASCVSTTDHGSTVHVSVPAGYALQDESPTPLAALMYLTGARTAGLTRIAVYPWSDRSGDARTATRGMASWLGYAASGSFGSAATATVTSTRLGGGVAAEVVDRTEPEPMSAQDPLRRAVLWSVEQHGRRFGIGVYTRADGAGDAVRASVRDSIGLGACP